MRPSSFSFHISRCGVGPQSRFGRKTCSIFGALSFGRKGKALEARDVDRGKWWRMMVGEQVEGCGSTARNSVAYQKACVVPRGISRCRLVFPRRESRCSTTHATETRQVQRHWQYEEAQAVPPPERDAKIDF